MSFLTKLYQTINHPKLIGGYFEKLQLQLMVGAPRKIRTDYGTENKEAVSGFTNPFSSSFEENELCFFVFRCSC